MTNPLKSQWAKDLAARHWGKLLLIQAIVLVGLGYFWASMMGGGGDAEPRAPQVAEPVAEASEAPTTWTCSMHPQIRRNGPGKCPLCGMDLVPVTSGSGGLRTLTVSPEARALMNIRTAPVEHKYVTAEVEMVGKVDYDETRLGYITAWIAGRLDRLYADYTGVEVKKGDHMVYIYSEELYSAQQELIQTVRYSPARNGQPSRLSTGGINLAESAREKLRLLGLTEEQIKEIETRDKPSAHLTIYAPVGGIVIEKLRQEGDRVSRGDRIYTIADLNQVWVKLDAYESDLEWIRYGQPVTFTTEAYPGEKFEGRIAFIQPVLNDKTRTVKVRVNVQNPEGKLKPEMFVRGVVRSKIAAGGRVLDPELAGKWISPMHPWIVKDEPGTCDVCGMPLVRAETLGFAAAEPDERSKPLVIPVSAALVTGKRAIVYVEVPDAKQPTFEGREIVLGPKAGDYYIVRSGLAQGELVVYQGNFKIDSEIQIQAKPSMMTPEGGGGVGHDHGGHAGPKPNGEHAGHVVSLPAEFQDQLRKLEVAYEDVGDAVELENLATIRDAFKAFGETLNDVDASVLTSHPLMVWNDLAMLLTNDVVEGREIEQMKDAGRVYELLADHMRRMQRQFPLPPEKPKPHRIEAPAEFQDQLATLWRAYLPIGEALAGDSFDRARQALPRLRSAISAVDDEPLSEAAGKVWSKEERNCLKILDDMERAEDITTLRASFSQLSDELDALIKTFGIGDVGPVYELHCPMAFDGRGAIWLQDDNQTRNPYYGATMLKCADRVDLIFPDNQEEGPEHQPGGGHQHE